MTYKDKEAQKAYDKAYRLAHAEKEKARHRAYYWAHKGEANTRSEEYYKEHRREILERAKRYRAEHPEYVKRNNTTSRRRLPQAEHHHLEKVAVLMHYSNPMGAIICNNCGEQDIDVLCIDHIKGGGNRHYKQLRRGNIGFYEWLIENSYPEGYQVLCFNCNTRKARYADKANNRYYFRERESFRIIRGA